MKKSPQKTKKPAIIAAVSPEKWNINWKNPKTREFPDFRRRDEKDIDNENEK